MPAMMAGERTAKPMIDEPSLAIGTLETMSADAAERERGITAPIEEEKRLLASRAALLDRFDEARRQPSPARRAFAPQIDSLEIGHAAGAESRGKLQPAVAALFGVDPCLDRGRRRSKDDGRALDPRPHHGHVARVVRYAVLLLVGRFVLLIDDDEPKVAE